LPLKNKSKKLKKIVKGILGVPAEKAGVLYVANFFRQISSKRFFTAITNAARIKNEKSGPIENHSQN
jgi:hypothetical protein